MIRRYILIFLSITFLFGQSVVSELKVGDEAPTFFVRDLLEKNFFFSDTLNLGKPILLSFFATWCVPCRIEMPVLDTLSHQYSDINFYMVNVSGISKGKSKTKENPEEVERMVDELGVNLQILMDKYGKVAEKYSIQSLPRLVVIDEKRKVHYIHDGYAPGDDYKLKEILDGLIDAKR